MAKPKSARNQVVIGLWMAKNSTKQIAERIGITEAGVKSLLSRLAAKGLIERGRKQITKAPEKEKTRKPEVLKTREPEKQRTREPKEKWQEGKRQISLWIPEQLAREIKKRAIDESRSLSDLGVDLFKKGLKK